MASYASPSQLRRLLDAVMAVAYDLDVESLLRHVVEAARELVGARYAAIGVLDPGRTYLAQFITVGIDQDVRERIGEPPKGHGILGLLITDPEPVRLPDIGEHPSSFGFPVGHPHMTTFLGVPLFVRGEVFGNLYLADKDGGDAFSDIDEELAVGLAGATALAIENARLHQRETELEVIADRERIARDLHDLVLQELFAVGIALQSTVPRVEDPVIARRLTGLVDDVDRTIKEIRTVIFGVEPDRGPTSSLREAVLEVAAQSRRALGFAPTVTFDGVLDSSVPGHVGGELLAVLREALSNVARHAGATRVEIRVAADSAVTLDVTDNGHGIPESPEAGNGLANMQARAEALGGTGTIGPGPNGGTVVHWAVPASL